MNEFGSYSTRFVVRGLFLITAVFPFTNPPRNNTLFTSFRLHYP
jgi:hypothetical protein